jgi:hypothetical protein
MNQIGDKRCGNPIKDNGCSKTQIKRWMALRDRIPGGKPNSRLKIQNLNERRRVYRPKTEGNRCINNNGCVNPR